MTTIYLIRHSTRFDHKVISSYYTSQSELIKNEKDILSIEGEERARKLSEEQELEHIDKVYVSNCVRTLQTAKYLLDKYHLSVTIDERLDERRVGKPNDSKYPDWFVRQYQDKSFKTEGGESQEDVCQRMNEVIHEIINENSDKRIAIFSHGYAICFYLLQFANLEYIDNQKNVKIVYKDKVLLDGQLNAPDVFRLMIDGDTVVDIDHIVFEDL